MSIDVRVLGVGMIPFTKPGAERPYDVMGAEAADARSPTPGSPTTRSSRPTSAMSTATPPRARRRSTGVGLTGIPIVNVNNNCSTGSTALYLARQAVESGAVDCVLALGFEQMVPGALGTVFNDRPTPLDGTSTRHAIELQGWTTEAPLARAALRRRGPDYIERVRHRRRRRFAHDLGQGAPARGEQPAAPSSATRSRVEEVMASPHICRPDHPVPGLPADLRRGGGGRVSARSSPPSTASKPAS